MRRRRKTLNLVMDGIDLYNTAYEDLSPTRTITPTKRSCFRDLVKNMFTSDREASVSITGDSMTEETTVATSENNPTYNTAEDKLEILVPALVTAPTE